MVAIRGTVITELMQWVQNFDIPQCEPSRLLRTDPQAAAAPDVPDARVHEGYNDALLRLFNAAGLRGELDKAKVTCGGKQRVLVTGHSKGGGMGQVLALALVRAGWDVVLVTFGAPPTINQTALDFLANSERLQAIRVCNVMDVVPRSLDLHPKYCHLGRHIVLDRLLLESANVLASVIKAAANSDNDLLDMATGAGLDVAEHHSMKRYLENLRMWDGGRWSFLALAQHSMRTIKNILDALPEQQAK